ncbi:MAG TPA: TIGR04282 family arsenosugar biosynthesis glycosyltransferase [Candidatus Binatia bacterium]|nr:TIGR04282 family arsenosugar biosynthesis glycosyltransferase [Candidatus Binatia bacterium]
MPTRVNALAVMTKAPIPGSVKTRMVPPLTYEQAAELCRALLLDQLEHLSALVDIDLYVAFSPQEAEPLIKSVLPAGYKSFPQLGEDLGARMNRVFDELWRRGHGHAAIIGSDVAAPPLNFFYDMFKQLSSPVRKVVLGPSQDGGYYLVGMNRPTPEIFSDMTWSHDQVLAQTTDRLTSLGVDFAFLPQWFDLDTLEDLRRLETCSDPAVREAMKQTLRFFRQLRAPGHGL